MRVDCRIFVLCALLLDGVATYTRAIPAENEATGTTSCSSGISNSSSSSDSHATCFAHGNETPDNTSLAQRKLSQASSTSAAAGESPLPVGHRLGQTSIREKAGGHRISIECESGWKVASGGCDAQPGNVFQYSMPNGDNGWTCGGHKSRKRVWVICVPAAIAPEIIESETFSEWNQVSCRPGQKVVGGGCDAGTQFWRYHDNQWDSPGWVEYSAPDGENGWKCGGHGSTKRVWALCVSDNDAPLVSTVNGGDWTVARCMRGHRVIGGGCHATDNLHKFQCSAPNASDAWGCGGFGGTKQVWAFCVPDMDLLQFMKSDYDDKCLHHDNSTLSVGSGVNIVRMRPCQDISEQQWRLNGTSIHPKLGSGRCLDHNFHDGIVYVHECHNGLNQKWSFHGKALHSDHDGRCLDHDFLFNHSVHVHPCHNSPNQRWYFAAASLPSLGDGNVA